MAEEAHDVKDNAGGRVSARDDHQGVLGESPNDAYQEANGDDGQRGLLARPGNVFEAVVADGAGHESAK